MEMNKLRDSSDLGDSGDFELNKEFKKGKQVAELPSPDKLNSNRMAKKNVNRRRT